jgi:hypothetical protein
MTDDEAARYRRVAGARLEPYRPVAVQRAIMDRVLPALLG